MNLRQMRGRWNCVKILSKSIIKNASQCDRPLWSTAGAADTASTACLTVRLPPRSEASVLSVFGESVVQRKVLIEQLIDPLQFNIPPVQSKIHPLKGQSRKTLTT
jgi:hypothetical protein